MSQHPRVARALVVLLALAALACLSARSAAGGGAAAGAGAPARYIVELAAPPLPPLPGPAVAAAGAAAQARALAAVAALTAAPAPPAYVYRHALNGFALDLTPAQAAAVAALPGVAGVTPDWTYTVASDVGPALIGAAQADQRAALFFAGLSGAQAATGRAVAHYDAVARALTLQVFYSGLSGPPTWAAISQGAGGPLVLDLAPFAVGAPAAAGGYSAAATLSAAAEEALLAGGLAIAIGTAAAPGGELRGRLEPARGEGVVIGVLDTGIAPGHPSFAERPADGYSYANPLGRRLGVCSPTDGDGRYDPSFPCNEKLIGAYTFAATEGAPDPQGQASPRDNHGHGSHVAGIAAGNVVWGAAVGGASLGPLAGVAPHASLIVYDVCGVAGNSRGCSGAAILAAIDQAIADGVAVLNLSLGGESQSPWAAIDARALLRATAAGSVVVASAGNGGPAAGTIGTPANAPWVTGAGSVGHGRRLAGSPLVREPDPASVDRLDAMSARGPDASVPALLKPDLVAPGVNVVAAAADLDPAAPDYQQLSGTSMAAPHVAGLAALLRQIHPGWSPAEIRSAMALTGAAARNHDGTPVGPFDQGGGRITAGGAALAGFVLDVGEAAYAAADPALGGDPAALNLPGLIGPGCVGGCVFTRTLRSTLGVPVTWAISAEGDGFTVTTEPAGALTLGPGETARLRVATAVTAPRPGATGFGRVVLTARGGLAPAATMPVAVPLDSSSLPGEILVRARGQGGSRAVPLRAMAIADLAVAAYGLSRLQPELITLGEDPTPGDYGDLLAGGVYRQVLTLPAGNVRFRAQVDQITARDVDLIVYVDQAGAGFGALGPEDTVLCARTGSQSEPVCDIVAPSLLRGRGHALQVTVLVQNREGSGAAQDSLRLRWARVNADQAPGGLAVSGPAAVAAGQPFALSLSWSLPGAQPGDSYIGALSLGSSPAAPADLGSALLNLEVEAERGYLPALGNLR